LMPVLRRFHVARFLRLLRSVGGRRLPLPQLDASVTQVHHEVRHSSVLKYFWKFFFLCVWGGIAPTSFSGRESHWEDSVQLTFTILGSML
jgi:hypothetical protein